MLKTIKKNKMLFVVAILLLSISVNVVYASTTNLLSVSQGEEQIGVVRENEDLLNMVPLFCQTDYKGIPYGEHGTIASHGCGLLCVAMVSTYFLEEFQDPVDLAIQFGNYNTPNGSYWNLITDSAKELGVPVPKETRKWSDVMAALENGQVVISIQRRGLFTNGGHFIVLAGLTEDGKILVNDPAGSNWNESETMIEGYRNGFTEEQVNRSGECYWIFDKKMN